MGGGGLDFSFKYGNILLVDGKFLQAGDADLLRGVLLQAHEAIAEKPREMSVWVVRLNAGAQSRVIRRAVLFDTEEPIEGEDTHGVYRDIASLQPRFHVYWHTAVNAGYVPEVRFASGVDRDIDGTCLLVRLEDPS